MAKRVKFPGGSEAAGKDEIDDDDLLLEQYSDEEEVEESDGQKTVGSEDVSDFEGNLERRLDMPTLVRTTTESSFSSSTMLRRRSSMYVVLPRSAAASCTRRARTAPWSESMIPSRRSAAWMAFTAPTEVRQSRSKRMLNTRS